MKYILNKLPVKTTNGFKINDVELDIDIPKYRYNNEKYDLSNCSKEVLFSSDIKNDKISSRIGLEVDSYYELKIKVSKNTHINEPQLITFDFKDNIDTFYSKLDITYEDDSYCDFVIIYNSKCDNKHFNYLIETVKSNNNSSGNITIINNLNNNSIMMYALENDVLCNASITHNIIDLGGATRLYNVYSNLIEKKANNTLNTIYIGKNDELLDFNYYLKNTGEETNNQMRVEGAIGDNCHKNFRGTIDFIKGCVNSIGEENENCILLSDTCRSRSLPQLLCGEENVVGSHGVSSGRVSEEKLFYLMSRGYKKKDAEKLIVLGNFMNIINSIPLLDVRNTLLEKIEKEI